MELMEHEKNWVREFSKCPVCGSEKRMFEQMGQEIKERGLTTEEMKFYDEMKAAPLANQDIIAKLPIGSEIPAFGVATDICLDCGCIYAVRLERTNAKKGLTPIQMMPNRAQRRAGMHGGKTFQLPNLNNLSMS